MDVHGAMRSIVQDRGIGPGCRPYGLYRAAQIRTLQSSADTNFTEQRRARQAHLEEGERGVPDAAAHVEQPVRALGENGELLFEVVSVLRGGGLR